MSKKQEALRENIRLWRKAYAEANIQAAVAKFGRELTLDECRYFHSVGGMMSEAWNRNLTYVPSPEQLAEQPVRTVKAIESDLKECIEQLKSRGQLREIE